jgi:ActR/RegA family two-component response regulator
MNSDAPVRVLLVDDDESILETACPILQRHGFEVVTSGTVADALGEIAANSFDVLIADLNIGSPGDGFTVVSAMRRTHRECVTLILTGFPAFDTALQAIRSQVDDYLIKPTHPTALVQAIESKLQDRRPHTAFASKRLGQLLRENAEAIAQATLAKMKSDPDIATLGLNDSELTGHMPGWIRQIAGMLDESPSAPLPPASMEMAVKVAEMRRTQGFPIDLIIRNVKFLEESIFETVHENLLSLNLSVLLPDLRRLNNGLVMHMERTVRRYIGVERQVA